MPTQQLSRASRELSWSGQLLLLVLTAWALAMILPSLAQVVTPFAAFGLSADNDGKLLDVGAPFEHASQSPATVAGLRPGDRIDLRRLRCVDPGSRECASLVAVLGGLGGLQYTRPQHEIDLPILQRNELVHLSAAPAPLPWSARVVLLANTIVAVAFILSAFSLVWTRPGPMTWGFFLFAAWFNPGQTFAFYALLQSVPVAVLLEQAAEAFLRGAGYAGLLAFAIRFPSDDVGPRWRRLNQALPWIGAAYAVITVLTGGNLIGFGTEAITRASLLAGYAVDALALTILLVRRGELAPQDQERMRWVIAGVVIGMPAFILAAICQSSGLVQEIVGAGPSNVVIGLLYLLNGVLAWFVAIAVRRRRVVSVSIPVRHGTIVALLTLTLAIPIVWLHEVLSDYQHHVELPEWVWPFVVAPVALLLLQRLHEIAVEFLDHVFNRGFHRARLALKQTGETMLKAETFDDVDRLLGQDPVRALRLASGAVFRKIDGTFRRAGDDLGWDADHPRELSPDADDAALRCIASGAPVRLPPGAWEQANLPPDERMPCLAVPVVGGAREAIAIALFGAHETGSDIDADEYRMLQDLAFLAAAGYDRVEVETLRREVTRLQAQLDASRAAVGA